MRQCNAKINQIGPSAKVKLSDIVSSRLRRPLKFDRGQEEEEEEEEDPKGLPIRLKIFEIIEHKKL